MRPPAKTVTLFDIRSKGDIPARQSDIGSNPESRHRASAWAGKDVPAGTMAMVSSTDFLRASERTTAIATLNRQRLLTPSCGGFTPTAERTAGPARTVIGELDTQTRN